MAFAPECVSFDRGDGSVMGQFQEKDYGHWFEFSRNDVLVISPPAHGGKNVEFPHKVWVGNDYKNPQYRYAKVGKTVAHVIVDETADGWVVEKWDIKNKRDYPDYVEKGL